VERNDPWARVVAAAGAIGAGVALVYVIGGMSLSLRYEGFGLPGQQAAALTPREVLLAAGLRTLVLWAAIGVALILALRALPDGAVQTVARRLRTRWGLLAVAALAVALLLVLKVWWPLAALGALLAIVLASVHWRSHPVRRVLVSALSIGLVAISYEADRISYLVEWTCVRAATTSAASGADAAAAASAHQNGARRVCGTLIGQQDRGFYLGVPGTADRSEQGAGPYRLVFIPATVVEEAYSDKRLARVIPSSAEARREPLRSRLSDIRVR
jgi:hypothetical protein